jgi:hypothetical protein
VFIANNALWRVRMFNEFVRMQADYNARVIAAERKERKRSA